MRLTFPHAQLERLLAVAEAGWPNGVRERYFEKDPPGFWLVGDQGVYLMSNAELADGEKPVVVYADECNPERLPFDEWYDNKQASFGGDDGVEFIEADVIRNAVADGSPLLVDFTPNEFVVSTLK